MYGSDDRIVDSVHTNAGPGASLLPRTVSGSSLSDVTAGSSARVYVSHLSGIGVFDPAGDTLGKVRDLVVVLRHDHEPPRVLGLVMEVQRRRIFLPMTASPRSTPARWWSTRAWTCAASSSAPARPS